MCVSRPPARKLRAHCGPNLLILYISLLARSPGPAENIPERSGEQAAGDPPPMPVARARPSARPSANRDGRSVGAVDAIFRRDNAYSVTLFRTRTAVVHDTAAVSSKQALATVVLS